VAVLLMLLFLSGEGVGIRVRSWFVAGRSFVMDPSAQCLVLLTTSRGQRDELRTKKCPGMAMACVV
jgi:hypothetical protein